MLPDEAFLRRLPTILDREQYLRITALVFSADTIASSYQLLRDIAARYIGGDVEMPRGHRILMFTHAWTIVDHVHICRQIFPSFSEPSTEMLAFVDDYESASLLRNQMDHLNGNIHNLANSTQRRPPIFGSISYVAIPNSEISSDENGPNPTRGFITTVTAGPLIGSQRFRAATPFGQDMRLPVGFFQLEAFDQMIKLEAAHDTLHSIMTALNADLEADLKEQAQQIAEKEGVPIEDLMGNAAEGLTIHLAIEFNDES